MLIAKKLPSEKQRKDPLWIIVVSIIIGSILSGLSDVLCISRMAATVYVFNHAILGAVSAYMVWNLVCIYHGAIY